MNAMSLDYEVLATKLDMPVKRTARCVGHFKKVFQSVDIKSKKILRIGAGDIS